MSIFTKLGAILFVYSGIIYQIFHDDGTIPVLIEMLNSVAIGPATAGSDIINICSDSLSTLLVVGGDSAVIILLTSSTETS